MNLPDSVIRSSSCSVLLVSRGTRELGPYNTSFAHLTCSIEKTAEMTSVSFSLTLPVFFSQDSLYDLYYSITLSIYKSSCQGSWEMGPLQVTLEGRQVGTHSARYTKHKNTLLGHLWIK